MTYPCLKRSDPVGYDDGLLEIPREIWQVEDDRQRLFAENAQALLFEAVFGCWVYGETISWARHWSQRVCMYIANKEFA